jgi:hypothetical protein
MKDMDESIKELQYCDQPPTYQFIARPQPLRNV